MLDRRCSLTVRFNEETKFNVGMELAGSAILWCGEGVGTKQETAESNSKFCRKASEDDVLVVKTAPNFHVGGMNFPR